MLLEVENVHRLQTRTVPSQFEKTVRPIIYHLEKRGNHSLDGLQTRLNLIDIPLDGR